MLLSHIIHIEYKQKCRSVKMDSYIVRIYRRTEEEKQDVTGLVEKIGAKLTRTFHNSDELVKILFGEKKPGTSVYKQTVASRASKRRAGKTQD